MWWRFALYWALLALVVRTAIASSVRRTQPTPTSEFAVQMVGYSPAEHDDYVAAAVKAPTGYIIAFRPLAHADRVHHMILYGCDVPYQQSTFWRGMATCGGRVSRILYAWARNAPSLELPPDVAFQIGDGSEVQHLVLQVHYAQPFGGRVNDFSGVSLVMTQQRPAQLAGVFFLVSGRSIPPRQPAYYLNMSCAFTSPTSITAFAFRTHTHAMGRVVSGYVRHDDVWTQIGKRSPQWPQLFQKLASPVKIEDGDLLAGQCRMDTSDQETMTYIGHTGKDEMCNFYIMYYYDANSPHPFANGGVCGEGEDQAEIDKEYPPEGSELLPPHPELEHSAHTSGQPFGVIESGSVTSIGGVKLGQVSGLAFHEDHVVVFHRGPRVWGAGAFQGHDLVDKTPIDADVILVANCSDQSKECALVAKYGRGQFFMPHGIVVDKKGDFYTTDVGSHTVIRWTVKDGALRKVWQAGVTFTTGSDDTHFCQPAGVAVDEKFVYVADGYCNSRVVKLDINNGQRVGTWGSAGREVGQFFLPHDVHVAPGQMVYVADRENGRVVVSDGNGQSRGEFKAFGLFDNVYSVDVHEDTLYLVPGRQGRDGRAISVYGARVGTGLIEYAFEREDSDEPFTAPHAVRVAPGGQHIYVGEISMEEGRLTWFRIQHDSSVLAISQSGSGTIADTATLLLSSIPTSAEGLRQLPTLLAVVSVFALVVVFLRQRSLCPTRSHRTSPQITMDRAGFKPLRTEDDPLDLGRALSDSDSD